MKKDLYEQYEELLSELEDLEVLDPPPGTYDFERMEEISRLLKEIMEELGEEVSEEEEIIEEPLEEIQEDD
jgi:hypothetical protein